MESDEPTIIDNNAEDYGEYENDKIEVTHDNERGIQRVANSM